VGGYGRWHGRWVGGSVELSVTVVYKINFKKQTVVHIIKEIKITCKNSFVGYIQYI